MIRKIWDFGTAEFMANDYVYFFTFCQVLNILRGKRTGGIFICHSQALYRVRPIPIYRYQYIGIGMETLQTDTDSWRLIHTDTDISVWYRYIGMIPIYGYVTDSFWLFTDITLKYRYHTDIPTIYRYRYPPYPPYRYQKLASKPSDAHFWGKHHKSKMIQIAWDWQTKLSQWISEIFVSTPPPLIFCGKILNQMSSKLC